MTRKLLPIAILEAIAIEHDIQIASKRDVAMNELIRSQNKRNMGSNTSALEAYANKALDNMVSELSSLGVGGGRYQGRNNTAYIFGAAIGNMVAAGMIDASVAESELINAAISSGLSPFEARAVSRGMKEGMTTPFDTNKLKHNNPYRKLDDPLDKYIPTISQIEATDLYDYPLLPGGACSWINQEYLPKSWIQTMLTLMKPRQKVVIVAIRLHHAFMRGELNPHCFTRQQVSELLGEKKLLDSTIEALETLVKWGFTLHNGVYKDIKSKPNHVRLNGRPALEYSIHSYNPSIISLGLLDRLERYVLEYHTDKDKAPLLHTLLHELSLDIDEQKAWFKRVELLVSPAIAYKIRADTRYWSDSLLSDNAYDELDYDVDDLDNTQLRKAILIEHLSAHKEGLQMSQKEVMRLIGVKSTNCFTKKTDDNLYTLAGIAVKKIQDWVYVDKPNECELREELQAAGKADHNREKQTSRRGGHVIGINIKYLDSRDTKGYQWSRLQSGNDMFTAYQQHKGRIIDISILVQRPSILRLKTDADYEKEAERNRLSMTIVESPKTDALSDSEDGQANTELKDKEKAKATINKPKKKRYTSKPDRDWQTHDKTWLWKQLQCEMYCFLNRVLTDDGDLMIDQDSKPIPIIIERENGDQVMQKLTLPKDVIIYISQQMKQRKIEAPLHMPDQFFGRELDLDFTDIDPPFTGASENKEEPIDMERIKKALTI